MIIFFGKKCTQKRFDRIREMYGDYVFGSITNPELDCVGGLLNTIIVFPFNTHVLGINTTTKRFDSFDHNWFTVYHTNYDSLKIWI